MAGLVFGVVAYVSALGAFAYLAGFVTDLVVPRTVDVGPIAGTTTALAIDLALVAVFALQHSVMARPQFKEAWTKIVPSSIERSTYVLASALSLALLCWQWRPIPDVVWDTSRAVYAIAALGWAIALGSTFLISHPDLFGLAQVWAAARGRAYEAPSFRRVFLYKIVRHPIMLGLLLAFWAAPTMTVGHLVLAGAMTAYIVVGVALEERELLRAFPDDYARYKREVGGVIPSRFPR